MVFHKNDENLRDIGEVVDEIYIQLFLWLNVFVEHRKPISLGRLDHPLRIPEICRTQYFERWAYSIRVTGNSVEDLPGSMLSNTEGNNSSTNKGENEYMRVMITFAKCQDTDLIANNVHRGPRRG